MCCCLPFGIVGIIYASQVDSHYAAGRYEQAYTAAKNAKMWTLIGVGTGVLGSIIYILFYGLAFLTAYV